MSAAQIKAVIQDTEVARIVVLGVPDTPGVAAHLFSALAAKGAYAEMIIQNNMCGGVNDIGFLVKKPQLEAAMQVCRAYCREIDAQGVSFDTEIARVTLVSDSLADCPEVPSEMFGILAEKGINIEMIASTSRSVTCVVGSARADEAVKALKAHFAA